MTKVVLAATVIASVVSPVSADALDPTVMAHIAVGEAGGWGIWGTRERAWEMQAMVIWVARNQAAHSLVPVDYDPQRQFYAWDEEITQADVDRAAVVLGMPQEQDPTQNALHVISEQDRVKLGFPRGDIVKCGVALFCLHWFKVWPDKLPEPTN